jgi:murein DD-endopeptidase MepM/ murein hydrolase activator NlpD
MSAKRRRRAAILVGVVVGAAVLASASRANASASSTAELSPGPNPRYGEYVWPVRGPVVCPFEAPDTPYGAGHRGIDIAAPLATPVQAAGPGHVAFAGRVAGELYVSVDHPDGVRTTYSWLGTVSVRAGDTVRTRQPIGATGPGHPGRLPPHLHFGARVGEAYIDPLLLLEGGSVVGLIRLATLDAPGTVAVPGMAVVEARGPPSRRVPPHAVPGATVRPWPDGRA